MYMVHRIQGIVGIIYTHHMKKFSLSLDMAEIFKPFILDSIVFSLVNTGKIRKEHFDRELNHAYLTESGRKIFLQASDDKLENSTIKHRTLRRNVNYRYLIRLERYKLIKHFLGERTVYTFTQQSFLIF